MAIVCRLYASLCPPTTNHIVTIGSKVILTLSPIQSIRSFVSNDQLSYTDDFWLLTVGEPSERGVRLFEFLPKRPLLNGYHVIGGCGTVCSFYTISFAETSKNKRPHESMQYITMFKENAFLCAPEDVENGCDPESEEFDGVLKMIDLIDDMFESATIDPQDGK